MMVMSSDMTSGTSSSTACPISPVVLCLMFELTCSASIYVTGIDPIIRSFLLEFSDNFCIKYSDFHYQRINVVNWVNDFEIQPIRKKSVDEPILMSMFHCAYFHVQVT